MEVIITHINADFDALASLLAAHKLYPEAKLVFPGSQEKSLRDFFVRSTFYVLEADRAKDIALERVTKLIMVDTRQQSRIGRFAEIVDRPDVEIHIYDHHPPSADDVRGTVEVIEEKGATITILLRVLRERGVPLTPDEATVMMLGIYEDTGSLTFSSTTEGDFHAAAYLLAQGASLNIISDMITRELSAEQVFLLNDLISSAERYDIRGVEVVVTTGSSDRYIGDVAVLVHKLKDMENLNCVFALIRMEDRIYLIGRSRVAEVDVAEVAVEFGGGGHSTAASATIRELTMVEAKERLLGVLHEVVRPRVRARDIMIHPLKTIHLDDTLKEAHRILSRYYTITVLPVLQGEQLVGLISRPIVERAMLHGLGDMTVKDYMTTDFAVVEADTPLREVQGHIVGENQRFLPVVEEGRLIGGITRTDLLRALHDVLTPSPLGSRTTRKKAVTKLMDERLSPPIVSLLRELGQVGEELGHQVYAVGGFVRDLILRRENYDIDVVVEGDGVHFAQVFGARSRCRVKVHKKMKTATLFFPTGHKIDVATARMEYYERPAALPTVELSSIKMDLFRRDFTINTLAIELRPSAFGQLLDFFGGQRDLKEEVIRVLHNLSFVEDPSRIFRAIRFEQRFGFHLGKHTYNLMKSAISMGFLERLSGARLFSELELILREKNPLPILERMAEFGLLTVFHPRLVYDTQTKALLARVYEVINWFDLLFLEESYSKWMVYLLGLADCLQLKGLEELAQRLSLPPRYRKRLIEGNREGQKVLQRAHRKQMSPKEIYTLFKPLPIEALLYIMAKTGEKGVKKAISLFFTQLNAMRVSLRGKDLQHLGIKPGPLYREILNSLLLARLEGKVKTKEEEMRYVRFHYVERKPFLSPRGGED
ncbi:MAG: polya polymerase [Deltaproteobacteria bacterium RBG_13_52_11]|nr:MAG: polya polymerase [Deltaproteobacteria bacterium RBG_13_52_11]